MIKSLLADVCPTLVERVRVVRDVPVRQDGEFVLCWLHHAVRARENPALDVAISISNAIDVPVLVYQGLGGRHRFNSDRHHVFIMEGARDLEQDLGERGISFAFHLPRDPGRRGPLRSLLDRACAFVTEDWPAPPLPRWTEALASRASIPALTVDAACLMPMRHLSTRCSRAFEFRNLAEPEWNARIDRPWVDVEPSVEGFTGSLGFESTRLAGVDLPDLAASCLIDHATPPVPWTMGGARAGEARWRTFLEHHLDRYHARRNDASGMDAVSGLSPWLHHGHVSPFRIAREAHERGGAGATKFLDELLTWRELSFHFCATTRPGTLESLDALPDWAASTLDAHRDDPREASPTWADLARASSPDDFWNTMQRSLVWSGELHNNARMTWGKAIPHWCETPERALRMLIDLNHRFALDGSDPNSYGGLLWCLGLFDRPFTPDVPVLGNVRPRSTTTHAKRLAPSTYEAAVRARRRRAPLRVAVVGAGVAGLTCARHLRDHGCEVEVLDRGRRPGGRLCTRRVDGDSHRVNHGAPSFECDDPRFRPWVASWKSSGLIDARPGSIARHRSGKLHPIVDSPFVGRPTMTSIIDHLAMSIDVRTAIVERVRRLDRGWVLEIEGDDPTTRTCDAIVLAAPPPQACRLLDDADRHLLPGLENQTYDACWALPVYAEGPDALPDDIVFEDHLVLQRLTRQVTNDAKGGWWVAHATPAWSNERVEADRESIGHALRAEVEAVFEALASRASITDRSESRAHRWKLATPRSPLDIDCLHDRPHRIATCSDAFAGGGVQGAFLSGIAAATNILNSTSIRPPASSEDAPSLFEVEP